MPGKLGIFPHNPPRPITTMKTQTNQQKKKEKEKENKERAIVLDYGEWDTSYCRNPLSSSRSLTSAGMTRTMLLFRERNWQSRAASLFFSFFCFSPFFFYFICLDILQVRAICSHPSSPTTRAVELMVSMMVVIQRKLGFNNAVMCSNDYEVCILRYYGPSKRERAQAMHALPSANRTINGRATWVPVFDWEFAKKL
ncbi:hypothetical protein BDV26DRAFT_251182 [Aspergillus bertholletiae]|uniref:Uncharacterized protein n=1 Tax=Aspergillus bertholletiae TaxID=1226010 RepID=A0A5N7BP04_9EURO|nr:hypothetical protein BDV26DRAFT_251182 [Aspergillus bertholletiae]